MPHNLNLLSWKTLSNLLFHSYLFSDLLFFSYLTYTCYSAAMYSIFSLFNLSISLKTILKDSNVLNAAHHRSWDIDFSSFFHIYRRNTNIYCIPPLAFTYSSLFGQSSLHLSHTDFSLIPTLFLNLLKASITYSYCSPILLFLCDIGQGIFNIVRT